MPHAVLSLLAVAGAVHIGVVASDGDAARRASAEIAAATNADIATCASVEDQCLANETCAKGAVAACHADAIVLVSVRKQKDGPWVATRVVDRDGSTVFSFDEPRPSLAGKLLSPALLSSLAEVHPAPPPPAAPATSARTEHGKATTESTATTSTISTTARPTPRAPTSSFKPWWWIAGAGGVVAVGAVVVAGAGESVRNDPLSPGAEKDAANAAAQVGWIGAIAGGALAAGFGVVAVMDAAP